MKKFASWLAINGALLAAVWLGFICDVEGARYLVKFFVWSLAALGIGALSSEVQKKVATEHPHPQPSREFFSHVTAFFVLCVFVWYGHIATALAWGFWMLCGAIARVGIAKHRAALSIRSA